MPFPCARAGEIAREHWAVAIRRQMPLLARSAGRNNCGNVPSIKPKEGLVATDRVDHAARVVTLEGGMPTLSQLHIRFD